MPSANTPVPTSGFPYNISKGTTLIISGREYVFEGAMGSGKLRIMDDHGAPLQIPDGHGGFDLSSVDWFDQMLREEQIRIVRHVPKTAARRAGRRREDEAQAIHSRDPKAKVRAAALKLIDDNGIPCGTLAIDKAFSVLWDAEHVRLYGPAPKGTTVRRWHSERGEPGDRKLRDAASMTGQMERSERLNRVVCEVKWKHVLLAAPNKGMSVADVRAAIKRELKRINEGRSAEYEQPEPGSEYSTPSWDTVKAAMVKVGAIPAAAGTKFGPEGARQRQRGAGAALEAARALEVCIVDHTPIEGFFFVDPDREIAATRAWLTTLMDAYSRAALGWLLSYEPPSIWSVAEVIRRASRPKAPPPRFAKWPGLAHLCGKSMQLLVDNGAEFVGHGLEDAASDCNIDIEFCEVGESQCKALGERLYRTVDSLGVEKLKGTSVPIEIARRFNFDAKKQTAVTVAQAEAKIDDIMFAYNVKPHNGIGKRPPLLAFQQSLGPNGIDIIDDPAELDRALGAIEPKVTMEYSGLRLFGMRYGHQLRVPELMVDLIPLEPSRPKKKNPTVTVKVKYNPTNISKVHVWNRKRKRYITLDCALRDYSEGMPLWFHRLVQAAMEAEGREMTSEDDWLDLRGDLVESIRRVSPEAYEEERRQAARLYEISRIREMTSEIASFHEVDPSPSGMSVVHHGLGAETRLDGEILSPRRKGDGDHRDSRDAGKPRKAARRAGATRTRMRGGARRTRKAVPAKPKTAAKTFGRSDDQRGFIYE